MVKRISATRPCLSALPASRPLEAPIRFRVHHEQPRPASGVGHAQAQGTAMALQRWAHQIERQRAELDLLIEEASRGKAFSAREILTIQARVYSLSEQVEVISQLASACVSTARTVLNMQV